VKFEKTSDSMALRRPIALSNPRAPALGVFVRRSVLLSLPWKIGADNYPGFERGAGIAEDVVPFPVPADLVAHAEMEEAALPFEYTWTAQRSSGGDPLSSADVDFFEVAKE
jgi:hypothetical protein